MAVTVSVKTTLEDIQKATPPGKVAMFRVTSMGPLAQGDDWLLGENVWVSRKGNVHDFLTEDNFGPASDYGLHFISYIERD